MCVEDLVSSSVNVTAELSKHEVANFVRMCQVFSKQSSTCYDECSTASTLGTVCKTESSSENARHEADVLCLIEKEISNSRMPIVLEQRKRDELEITSLLATYIRNFDPSLKLYPFGSTEYGVRIAYANLNLCVSTSELILELVPCAFSIDNYFSLSLCSQMVESQRISVKVFYLNSDKLMFFVISS